MAAVLVDLGHNVEHEGCHVKIPASVWGLPSTHAKRKEACFLWVIVYSKGKISLNIPTSSTFQRQSLVVVLLVALVNLW
jgi:hypothetical protein